MNCSKKGYFVAAVKLDEECVGKKALKRDNEIENDGRGRSLEMKKIIFHQKIEKIKSHLKFVPPKFLFHFPVERKFSQKSFQFFSYFSVAILEQIKPFILLIDIFVVIRWA